MCEDREWVLVFLPLIRIPILTGWGCALKTLFHPDCLIKGPSSDTVTLGVRAYEFEGEIQISPNSAPNNRSVSGVTFMSRSAVDKVKKFLLARE